MEEETMAVPPSEENGNLSVEAEPDAPSEEPVEEAPAEEVETETTTETEEEEELFELPDGRKVDAETVAQEYRNLLSDYTKKSQALAAKETLRNEPTDPLADPNYVPETYAALRDQIKADTLKELERAEANRLQQQKEVEDTVNQQLTDIKKADPTLDENALFLHANKYGFRDLKQAHANMADMRTMAKKVQQTTAANVAKRVDPVSKSPGATGARPEATQFATAQDYLRALKASGK